jgi:hypothetical protein
MSANVDNTGDHSPDLDASVDLSSSQHDASALPSTTADKAPESDSMQGLKVMAKAAEAARPQELLELVDDDVEVVIPVQKQIDMSMSLASVYAFTGTAEFKGKLNSNQKRSVLNVYLRGIDVGLAEQPLSHFHNWFSELRFRDAILQPSDGKNHLWYYRNVLVNPKTMVLKPNVSFGNAPLKFLTNARKFYESIFHASESMTGQIARAVENDVTLLILALRVEKATDVNKTFSAYSDASLITVAAISFQMFRDPINKETMSVFLSLLGVTHHSTAHPLCLKSWRRNGIGLFMLIQVIKRCLSVEGVTSVDVYLQCSEPSAFFFYTMIGFRCLNKKNEVNDGYALLPNHVRTGLESSPPVSAFLQFPNSDPLQKDHQGQAPFLMHLRHGALKHVKGEKKKEKAPDAKPSTKVAERGDPMWCQYPPPRLAGGSGRLVYDQKDADSLFASLPLLRKLFPSPLQQLLPAAALRHKGEMTLENRVKHTEDQGMKWMATGELDLMLSILTCDGRYEDAAFILPVNTCEALRLGFGAFYRYTARLRLKKANETMDPQKLEKLIKKKFKESSDNIQSENRRQYNYVLEHLVDRNPGLLSKKVLVFPQNEGDLHWSVTFVFNAGCIDVPFDASNNTRKALQPCFFRYCSSIPEGSRNVCKSSGIIWFLNLCYSNQVLDDSMPDVNAIMKWKKPFGKQATGNILGTKAFPSLRLRNPSCLPQQVDGCNCGIGIIAAIAIILRNVVNEKPEQRTFTEQFGPDNDWTLQEDAEKGEVYFFFDHAFFEPIPSREELIWNDYLSMLREEWFVLLDRMAALHFEVLPQRLNKDNLVHPLYNETKRKTAEWPDPESMKVRQTMSKAQLRRLVKEREAALDRKKKERSQKKYKAASSPTVPIDVTQSPGAPIDLSSPESKLTPPRSRSSTREEAIDLSSPEPALLQSASDTQANAAPNSIDLSSPHTKPDGVSQEPETNDTPKNPTRVPRVPVSLLRGKVTTVETTVTDPASGVVKKVEIKKMEDPSLVLPVKLHVTTPQKRKQGDLLKRLHLDDVVFDDDDDDDKQKSKKKKRKSKSDGEDYVVLTDKARKEKVSTQATSTIQAFHQMYHATPAEDSDVVTTIDKRFKADLNKFIADSFEKWNWHSEDDHQKTIAEWAKKMKDKNASVTKKEWIRELIGGLKEERAHATKHLTNEFMFTRPTMVKGLRFVKANNSFYGRLVYQEPDQENPKQMVISEEELRVEEEWVRSEFASLDIQHIINMHQVEKWTDVPRDVEVRIAKHKVVRVRYVPQVRQVIDYDKMAKAINEKDVTLPLRRKRLGFPELLPERKPENSLLDEPIPKRRAVRIDKFQTPSKVARKPMVVVVEENEAKAKQLEKEEAKWQKCIIRKSVTINEKWKGRMENGQETTLEEEFVRMSFGEAFVNELKMSDVRGQLVITNHRICTSILT